MDKLQDYSNPYYTNTKTKKSVKKETKKSNSKEKRNTPLKGDHNVMTVNDILRETMPRMNAPQPSIQRQDVFLEELKDEPVPTKAQTTKSKKPVRPRNKSNFPETPVIKSNNITIPKTSGPKKLRACVSQKSFKDSR